MAFPADWSTLQWVAEGDAVLWTSRFPDDAYPPATHAVIHLELGEKGEAEATGSLTPPEAVALPLLILCRTFEGDAAQGITFTLQASRAQGEAEVALGSFHADGASWKRVSVQAPEGAPGGPCASLRVEASGRGTLAVCLLGREGAETEPVLAALGSVYQAQGKTACADLTWRQVEAETTDPVMKLRSQAHLADCLLASGKPQDVGAKYLAVWGALGTQAPLAAPDAPPQGYGCARATVDAAPYVARRLGEACAALDAAADPAMLRVAGENWPLGEVGCRAALQLAETSLAAGKREEACGLALRVLHRYPDAGPPRTALLPDNAAYLAAANYLPDSASFGRALGVILADAPERVAQAATDWLALEQAADAREVGRVRALAGTVKLPADRATLLHWLHVAQVLLRTGRPRECLQWASCAVDALREEDPLRTYGNYLSGAARCSYGNYATAVENLSIAAEAGDAWLAGLAALERGEALEYSGRRDEAATAYGELLAAGPKAWWWARVRAAAGLRRVSGSAPLSAPGPDPSVVYLGEERQTSGDWFRHFGGEAFCLCAGYSPRDQVGGPRWRQFQVQKRTGRADDPARTWATAFEDADPSSLYNPCDDLRRAANWDDHGEAYPAGAGPDLIVECPVPDGLHRLSLYFVNDHNYYEPSRDYTVEVTDATGAVAAVTGVRHFLSGVYKLFGVRGPQVLSVRIRRNGSLNVVLGGIFLDRLEPVCPASFPGGSGLRLGTGAGAVRLGAVAETARGDQLPLADDTGSAADAWADLQTCELVHQDPEAERLAFRTAAEAIEREAGAEAARSFLQATMQEAASGDRGWVAYWAADMRAAALEHRQEAQSAQDDLEAASTAFLSPVPGFSWGDDQVPVHLPIARELLLRIVTSYYREDDAVSYCRSFAARYQYNHRPLVACALKWIIDRRGAAALSEAELGQYVSTAKDLEGETRVLEERLLTDPPLPEAWVLWDQLVGHYVELRADAKIDDLAKRLVVMPGDDEQRAQLLLTCAVCYKVTKVPERARNIIRAICATFPRTRAAQSALDLKRELQRRGG